MCQWNTSDVVALPPNVDTSKEVRSVSLDRCLVPAIKAIWAAGFETLGCCCGHDKEPPSVIVPEGHTDTDIAAIIDVLRRVDGRSWNILQWRLITVQPKKRAMTEENFKNPLPEAVHDALVTVEDFLRAHIYGEGWRGVSASAAFAAVRRELNMEKYGTPEPPGITVTPKPSFQPPETCPDCLAGIPFGDDGRHVTARAAMLPPCDPLMDWKKKIPK